jgi:hypothetical protein
MRVSVGHSDISHEMSATTSTRRARLEGRRTQNAILFLAALLLALTIVAAFGGSARASFRCAARSISTGTAQCEGSAARHGPAPAGVTFVFER